MEFKQLRAFVTLAEMLNFTRASELLYVSQSTLSKQILSLEESLGVRLLLRDTHTVMLTDEGAHFLKYAREILELSALSEERVRNFIPNRSVESLTIGYDVAIDATVELADIIATTAVAFQRTRPNVAVKIVSCSLEHLSSEFQLGAIDLAISIQDEKLFAPFKSEDCNAICLRMNHFVMVVQAQPHVDYETVPLYEALSKYEIACIPPHQTMYNNIGLLFDKIGIWPFIKFDTSFVDTIRKVARGDCFTVMPELQFDKLHVEGIAKIAIPDSLFGGDMRLIWKKETDNRFIQEFIRLCNEFKESAFECYT